MGKRSISPPDDVWETLKKGIADEKEKNKPRFDFRDATDFFTKKARELIKQFNLKKPRS